MVSVPLSADSPELLDVAHSFGELMTFKALQYRLHSCLRGGEAGYNHGSYLGVVGHVLQVGGYDCLGYLQAGLQLRELERHVQKLQGERESARFLIWCECITEKKQI